MEISWNAVGLAVAVMLYGGMGVYWMRRPIAAAFRQFRALPRFAQAMLAVMAVVATVEAQKRGSGNGEPGTGNGGGMGKEHTCHDHWWIHVWFVEKNTHAMTLVVDPCVVCGNNTHAMTTGGSMCGLWKRTHMQ